MNFLPVVQRELAVASRRPFTHWIRMTVAGSAMLFSCLFLLFSSSAGGLGSRSQAVFYLLAVTGFGFALLSGPVFASDSIAREKEEGTLGLLFLTELRGYDVLLGKLAMTSLQTAATLLAVFPVMALPLLFGGVSFREFWCLVGTLSSTMALSLAVGMLCSVMARRSIDATAWSFLFSLTLVTLPFLVFWIGSSQNWLPFKGFHEWGPLGALIAGTLDPGGAHSVSAWGTSVRLTWWVALALIVVACVLVPWTWRTATSGFTNRPTNGKTSIWSRNPMVGYRHKIWASLLASNPYTWMCHVLRPLTWPARILLTSGTAFLIVMMIVMTYVRTIRESGVLFLMIMAYYMMLKLLLALHVTRGVTEDCHEGRLELILSTRQSGDSVREGFFQSIHHVFGWWMAGAGAIGVAAWFLTIVFWPRMTGIPDSMPVLWFLIPVALLLLDYRTIVWVGMRESLRCSNSGQAFRRTILRCLVPGWVVGLCIFGLGAGIHLNPSFMMAVWGVVCWITSMIVLNRSAVSLNVGLREMVAGLEFDVDEAMLRADFRRALETEIRAKR